MMPRGASLPTALVVAAAFACSGPEPVPYHERESRLAIDQGITFFARGQLDLADERFRTALRSAEAADLRTQEAIALDNLGMVALAQDEPERAAGRFTAALQMLSGTDESALHVELLLNLATAEMAAGESAPPSVEERLSRALALGEQLERGDLVLRVRQARGLLRLRQGQPEAARTEWEAALADARAAGDAAATSAALVNLASLERRAGRHEDAIAKLEQALAIDKTLEDAIAIGNDLELLADAHEQLGHRDAARDLAVRALAIHEKLPNEKRVARDHAVIERLK